MDLMPTFRRSLACVLDSVLVFGVSFIAWKFQSFATPDATGNYGGPGCLLVLVNLFAYFMYYAVMESRLGYTLGKGLFNLEVVDEHDRTPTFEQTLKRHLLDVIEFQFFGLPAFVAVRLTGGARLGDLWARTRVVDAGS